MEYLFIEYKKVGWAVPDCGMEDEAAVSGAFSDGGFRFVGQSRCKK